METETDTEELALLHFTMPCPACDRPAQVVADPLTRKARWCCTACLVLGAAPFALPEGITTPPTRPAALA